MTTPDPEWLLTRLNREYLVDPREPVLAARELFFDAVRRHRPEVLKDLAGAPLEHFSKLPDYDPSWQGTSPTWSRLEAALPARPEFVDLHASLVQWSSRWHLDAEWCIDKALWTLESWVLNPADDPLRTCWDPDWPLEFLDPDVFDTDAWSDDVDIVFRAEGWDSTFESRGVARARIMTRFEALLDQRLDASERMLVRMRKAPAPEKRKLEHFEWLACYQVSTLSMAMVAERVAKTGTSREAVRKAIHELAAFIGLTLRAPNRPGRPRGAHKRRLPRSTRPVQ